MSYQVILFDLDDTLLDFTASEAISLRKIHQRFYPEFTYSLFEGFYREVNQELWRRVGAKENSLMPNDVRFLRFRQLNEKLAATGNADEIADAYEDHLQQHIDWFPDTQKAIEFLHQKGHRLGIITNGFSESQNKKKQKLALETWFDCFIISDDIGVAKPHKEIFEIALEKLAIAPHQPLTTYHKDSVLMVGDSLISDGYGAKNFGINYCHVSRDHTQSLPLDTPLTYHISSVANLPHCIGYQKDYELFLGSF